MALTISITNQKGGVGKTTTSVNLAAGLAKKGYKTLIIDFDPQGHTSQYLGIKIIQSEDFQKTILEVLEDKKRVQPKSCVYPSYATNLWVVPANLKLGQFNQNDPNGRQFNLKNAIQNNFNDSFDYIIIDCQPSLSLLTLNALTACDKVLLPVQSEFLALDGLTQLLLTLKEIKTRLNPKLSVLGILLTMFDRRNRLSSEVRAELVKNFKRDLFYNYIPRSVKLAESPSFGKSIFDYDNNSSGAQAYRALTDEVLERVR